ncbi:uncharacterized protein LOC131936954 isoform X2 [Physella acuta]|uniref:uncharacterized protein LOC131936954 isoform X2 n=1 Tax=Physella acuta TaxID=109671 RepID=UPI0027DCD424|nr:uncharacterized protein LOC131936954 isoform X2 [Physella acuta]
MRVKMLLKQYQQNGLTSLVKHRYFPAKKPKFKKSYFPFRQLKKDFQTRLVSSANSYNASHLEEETDAQSLEVVSTENGLPTFDELTEGSGYSSLTSADLWSDTGLILRDGLTSLSAQSSHLLSSIGTNSLFSSVLFSSINEYSNSFSSESDDLDFSDQLYSEADRNQENPMYLSKPSMFPEPISAEISFQNSLQDMPQTTFDYFMPPENDHYSEAYLDGGSNMTSISEFLGPDDSFLQRAVVDSSQTVPQINSESFAWRENQMTNVDLPPAGQWLKDEEKKQFFQSALNTFEDTCKLEQASPASVYDSQFSEVPADTNVCVGETNAETCDPNWTCANFLSPSFSNDVTDLLDLLDVTSLVSSAEDLSNALVSFSEDLESLNSWQGNVKDAGHTPYGSGTSEDDVFPVSLEPGVGEGDAVDGELLQEAAASKVGSSQDLNDKTSQWVWETFLWPGKFNTLSAKDEIETDSPGPAKVTSADVSPLCEASLREVDGALWDVDRPKSSHLLPGSANENGSSEAVRDRNLDLQQVPQPVVSHNTSFEAHGLVLSAQPADALPVTQGRSEFLQRSEGRSNTSFPRLERSSSASASRSNVLLAERSFQNLFPRFKRSLSDSLLRSHDRSQPYFLQRSQERPEQVFLPVLEVYSTLQPPQEVPEILPSVEHHGPIYQESFQLLHDDIDQTELDYQIQHPLFLGTPLPSDVHVNQHRLDVDIRESRRIRRFHRL